MPEACLGTTAVPGLGVTLRTIGFSSFLGLSTGQTAREWLPLSWSFG